MKHLRIVLKTLWSAAFLLTSQTLVAQHLNAGASGHNQNDPLLWANGSAFAASSGYVHNLGYTNAGRYAGLFQGNITLTALASTNNGAALGSFIAAQIVSVEGPAGGVFGFWEGADQGGGASPLHSIATGSSGLSHQFALSDVLEGAGQPGQDPFGHLHGRRFTATEPGLYTVGFRAIDTSGNGLGGGPIHAASDILFINFAAVPEPSTLAMLGVGAVAAFVAWRRRKP